MGDLRLSFEQRDGRDLVFASLDTGQVIWGMDAGSRQEWWYAPELATEVLPDLRAALSVPAQTVPPVSPPVGPGCDLATHRPGHAVLAAIEVQHRAATSSVMDGMPGTLDEGIVKWCIGYVGEAQVGAELEKLGPHWRVLHGVPVGFKGSDIDHVVIGPGGVFTINTKHHAGINVDVKGDAVFVGRDFRPYVRNARTEIDHARSTLSATGCPVPASALIVTVGARLRVKQAPDDVTVLDAAQLVAWLEAQPAALTETQVDYVFEKLRWSGHWTTELPPAEAAAWVDGFARQMATEQAIAKAARRRGLGPAPTAARSKPSRTRPPQSPARNRRRKSSKEPLWLGLLKLVGGLLLILFMLKMAPAIIASFTQTLTTPRPTTTSSTPPVATSGAACTVRGATATTAAGAPLVCAPVRPSTRLAWQTPAS